MLVPKVNINNPGMRIFKITTGQDVIGMARNLLDNDIFIKQPYSIRRNVAPNGSGLSLFPFMDGTTDDEIKISQNSIMATGIPTQEFIDAYNTKINTKDSQ